MRRTTAVLTIMTAITTPVMADGIPKGLGHPQGAQEHWYDSRCCSMKDCEPVEVGAIQPTPDGYAVRYMSSRGFIVDGFAKHGSQNIMQSRNSQEHACATRQRLLCIYIHIGS